MGDKIALGFHACVDYELCWDQDVIEELIKKYEISDSEITGNLVIETERELLLACLSHMKKGTGGELIPEHERTCLDFAGHFQYKVTIGGTAARAAIAIAKIGYASSLQTCCLNEHIKKLLPGEVHCFSGAGEDHMEVYPHIVLQYQANIHLKANDIDFTTPRENRVLISRDLDSLNMRISEDFAPFIQDAEVFLLSCFSEVLDAEILKDRMEKTRQLLSHLPEKALVVLEDGCYIKREHRFFVHQELKDTVDILSMNEDELQDYVGRQINVLDPETVADAVNYVQEHSGIPTIIVHSSVWALSYGRDAYSIRQALEGGIVMAAARYRKGDQFAQEEYKETKSLPDRKISEDFCKKITDITEGSVCCLPCKDLDSVKNPTVVGLGDFFAGGLLPQLLVCRRSQQ